MGTKTKHAPNRSISGQRSSRVLWMFEVSAPCKSLPRVADEEQALIVMVFDWEAQHLQLLRNGKIIDRMKQVQTESIRDYRMGVKFLLHPGLIELVGYRRLR